MWPDDLQVIYKRFKNLRQDIFGPRVRPFLYQEVIDFGNGEGSNKWNYNNLGTVIEFIYGDILGACFRGRCSLHSLQKLEDFSRDLMMSDEALVMIDNHDNQRSVSNVLSYKNGKIYKVRLCRQLLFCSVIFSSRRPSRGHNTSNDTVVVCQ
jgi:hypothetical protein